MSGQQIFLFYLISSSFILGNSTLSIHFNIALIFFTLVLAIDEYLKYLLLFHFVFFSAIRTFFSGFLCPVYDSQILFVCLHFHCCC